MKGIVTGMTLQFIKQVLQAGMAVSARMSVSSNMVLGPLRLTLIFQ